MISLETEATLRVEQAAHLQIACVAGVVWITQAGDVRDLFVAAGESLTLAPRGLTLMTALEPATVRIIDEVSTHTASGRWRQAMMRAAARIGSLARSRQPIRI